MNIFVIDKAVKQNLGAIDFIPRREERIILNNGWKNIECEVCCMVYNPREHGLLVFAKERSAARLLAAQLKEQEDEAGFSKRYRAVLCGILDEKEGKLEDNLCKVSLAEGKQKEYRAIIADACLEGKGLAARRAELEYRICQIWEEKGLSLTDIRLVTGRFHQIRAQMSHAGAPLLGDMKYGDEKAKELARTLGIRYVALCAYSLEFVHPASQKRMEFRTEPRNPAFSFFSQL